MYCTNCGSKNKDGVKFCVECGKEIISGEKNNVKDKKKRSWKDWLKLTIKGFFILFLLGVAWSLIAGFYYWYQNLPREIDELADVSLGMKPVEVTLAKGKPNGEIVGDDNKLRYIYTDVYKSPELFIKFGDASGNAGVITICSYEFYDEVFGLGEYDTLDQVTKKLGEPTGRSINADGTQQLLTYSQYNVGFVVSENKVQETCVTSESKMSFIEEY